MTQLLGMELVKRCECFETMNAIYHQPMLENFDVKPPYVFVQEFVGQSRGCRMAMRTLSRKDGTVWTEAGMWSPKSFERLRPQLQGSIPSLAPAPAPSSMSRRFRLHLRFRGKWPPAPVAPIPAPDIWILVFLYGSVVDTRPRKACRPRL